MRLDPYNQNFVLSQQACNTLIFPWMFFVRKRIYPLAPVYNTVICESRRKLYKFMSHSLVVTSMDNLNFGYPSANWDIGEIEAAVSKYSDPKDPDLLGLGFAHEAAVELGHDGLVEYINHCLKETLWYRGRDPSETPYWGENSNPRETDWSEKLEVLKGAIRNQRGSIDDYDHSAAGALYKELFFDPEVDGLFWQTFPGPRKVKSSGQADLTDRGYIMNLVEEAVLSSRNLAEAKTKITEAYRTVVDNFVSKDVKRGRLNVSMIPLAECVGLLEDMRESYFEVAKNHIALGNFKKASVMAEIVGFKDWMPPVFKYWIMSGNGRKEMATRAAAEFDDIVIAGDDVYYSDGCLLRPV